MVNAELLEQSWQAMKLRIEKQVRGVLTAHGPIATHEELLSVAKNKLFSYWKENARDSLDSLARHPRDMLRVHLSAHMNQLAEQLLKKAQKHLGQEQSGDVPGLEHYLAHYGYHLRKAIAAHPVGRNIPIQERRSAHVQLLRSALPHAKNRESITWAIQEAAKTMDFSEFAAKPMKPASRTPSSEEHSSKRKETLGSRSAAVVAEAAARQEAKDAAKALRQNQAEDAARLRRAVIEAQKAEKEEKRIQSAEAQASRMQEKREADARKEQNRLAEIEQEHAKSPAVAAPRQPQPATGQRQPVKKVYTGLDGAYRFVQDCLTKATISATPELMRESKWVFHPKLSPVYNRIKNHVVDGQEFGGHGSWSQMVLNRFNCPKSIELALREIDI